MRSSSYLLFGEADELLLLLGLHEADRHDRAAVSAQGAHRFGGHAGVPQQHPVVHARRGCNQSEETGCQTGGAEEPQSKTASGSASYQVRSERAVSLHRHLLATQ